MSGSIALRVRQFPTAGKPPSELDSPLSLKLPEPGRNDGRARSRSGSFKPSNPLTVNTESTPVSQPKRSSPAKGKAKTDRPKKINIDIGESRHNRLNELAAQIRANNADPVAPSERMYPIHLIQIAIDFLLDDLEINWDEIQKPEDLRKAAKQFRSKPLNRY